MPIDIHDATRLKELQALPLDRKIAITQARIIEWFQFWEGQVYLSFSGGKDSTVLLDIVTKTLKAIDPTFKVPVVFSNTGLEYPEIQRFAKSKGATFVTPKMNIVEVIRNYGYPLISKEVSNAIYYARRIKPYTSEGGQSFKYTMHKQRELLGIRYDKYLPRLQGNNVQATGTARQTTSEQARMGARRVQNRYQRAERIA